MDQNECRFNRCFDNVSPLQRYKAVHYSNAARVEMIEKMFPEVLTMYFSNPNFFI